MIIKYNCCKQHFKGYKTLSTIVPQTWLGFCWSYFNIRTISLTMDMETERIYYKKMAKSTFHFSFVLIHTLKQFSTAHENWPDSVYSEACLVVSCYVLCYVICHANLALPPAPGFKLTIFWSTQSRYVVIKINKQ